MRIIPPKKSLRSQSDRTAITNINKHHRTHPHIYMKWQNLWPRPWVLIFSVVVFAQGEFWTWENWTIDLKSNRKKAPMIFLIKKKRSADQIRKLLNNSHGVNVARQTFAGKTSTKLTIFLCVFRTHPKTQLIFTPNFSCFFPPKVKFQTSRHHFHQFTFCYALCVLL